MSSAILKDVPQKMFFHFQAKLGTFFESIGWKVFRVPETATVLMSGGIAFGELNEEQIMDFQVLDQMLAISHYMHASP